MCTRARFQRHAAVHLPWFCGVGGAKRRAPDRWRGCRAPSGVTVARSGNRACASRLGGTRWWRERTRSRLTSRCLGAGRVSGRRWETTRVRCCGGGCRGGWVSSWAIPGRGGGALATSTDDPQLERRAQRVITAQSLDDVLPTEPAAPWTGHSLARCVA